MVEHWSSKPYAWVRFLLPLFILYFKQFKRLIKLSPNLHHRKNKNNIKQLKHNNPLNNDTIKVDIKFPNNLAPSTLPKTSARTLSSLKSRYGQKRNLSSRHHLNTVYAKNRKIYSTKVSLSVHKAWRLNLWRHFPTSRISIRKVHKKKTSFKALPNTFKNWRWAPKTSSFARATLWHTFWSQKLRTQNIVRSRFRPRTVRTQNSSIWFRKQIAIGDTGLSYLSPDHNVPFDKIHPNVCRLLNKLNPTITTFLGTYDYGLNFKHNGNDQLKNSFNFDNSSLKRSLKVKLFNNAHLFHQTNPTQVFLTQPAIFKTLIAQPLKSSKLLSESKLLLSILIENTFINSRKQNNLKPTKVLSKAANYKMDDTSAITADRHRGNFYSRWGFARTINFQKFHALAYLTSLYNPIDKVRFSQKISPTLSWAKQLTLMSRLYRSYFYQVKVASGQSVCESFSRPLLNRLYSDYSNQIFTKTNVWAHSSLHYRGNGVKKNRKYSLYTDRRINLKLKQLKNLHETVRRHKTNLSKQSSTTKLLRQSLLHRSSLKNVNYYKSYKKHTAYTLNVLKWKLNKRSNRFTALRRLSRKRKNYLKTFKARNLVPTRTLTFIDQMRQRTVLKRLQNHPPLVNTNETFLGTSNYSTIIPFSSVQNLTSVISKPILLKYLLMGANDQIPVRINTLTYALNKKFLSACGINTNLTPHASFRKSLNKKVLNSFTNKSLDENLIPWYYHTLVRFLEHCSGKKVFFQFYPFMNQSVSAEHAARYSRWLPRMAFYERKLGHRFFLEEALHIMHLSFALRDPKILASWLKAMILRISFWKTRSIFRFLKYLFHNYFRFIFDDIGIKGLKIKLKGKISAAGNSRKRTILYRVGKTSHSETRIRVLTEFATVNTFTGVMGLSIWLFY